MFGKKIFGPKNLLSLHLNAPSTQTQNTLQAPSGHLPVPIPTPPNCLPDTFHTPSRHPTEILETPSRHPPETFQTPSRLIELSNFFLSTPQARILKTFYCQNHNSTTKQPQDNLFRNLRALVKKRNLHVDNRALLRRFPNNAAPPRLVDPNRLTNNNKHQLILGFSCSGLDLIHQRTVPAFSWP